MKGLMAVVLLALTLVFGCHTRSLHEYDAEHKLLCGEHGPASFSRYRIVIYSKQRKSIPDEEFIKHVLWMVEDTDYIRIRWEYGCKRDGSGDEYCCGAIVYYSKEMKGKK